MTTWNHRILRREDIVRGETEVSYGVYEVFYGDDGKPHSCTATAVEPYGETEDDLRQELQMMLRAFDQPILSYEDF